MRNKIKKSISVITIIMTFFCGILGIGFGDVTEVKAAGDYNSKINAFISDGRWANGVAWGSGHGAYCGYPSSGCAAYCADFENYVYGTTGWKGTAFYSAGEIRSGDILHVNSSEYGQHWFVVLSRNGNSLYTAEGNYSSRVFISNSRYTISGNNVIFYAGGVAHTYTITTGYHFNTNFHTHSYSASVTKQPTCTATGIRTYKCSCGATYTENIAAKGHTYKNQVVAPTTTEKGYTLHTCTVCGYGYKDSYVNCPELGSDGWYTCSTLPSGITSDKYTIQYNNHYEKVQASSPGSDWTKAATVKDEWQNSGSTYNTESDLPTSDSRVLVRSVYYHFCGPNAGAAGNYEISGNFVHYDEVEASRVIPTYCGVDNGHPYYVLDWSNGGRVWCQSGVTCDGAYGSHGNRCKAWYKTNVYQDRVHVVQYKYTKDSGWVEKKDNSAASVKIRYKEIEVAPTQPETPTEPVNPGIPENPTEPTKSDMPEYPMVSAETTKTTDAHQFSVKYEDNKFYFTWNVIDSTATYKVEYSIIPTAGFLEETMYEVVPVEEGKMCYVTNALPYNDNSPLYFRVKQQKANANPIYSDVVELNWITHKVTFMDGNKVVSVQNVYNEDSAKAPSLVKEGYELSWGGGDYTYVTSDMTVYAVWTKKEEDVKQPTTGQSTTKQPTTGQAVTGENLPQTGTQVTVGNGIYQVTKSTSSKKEVTYVKPKSSKKSTVTIPDTVKINRLTYKVTSVAASALSRNKKVSKVTVGKNVTFIGKNAFKKCTKLKKVTLKSVSLKSIGASAFYGDKNLKTITIKSKKLTSKRIGKNAFKGTNKKLTIKVPKKKISSYRKFLKKKGNTKVKIK